MYAPCSLSAYDVFAVGMTHRIAVGAVPQLRGETMLEKQTNLEEHYDEFRQRVVCGAADPPNLVGVLVTEPTHPDADVGIIYFVQQGYWMMCGSGTFALGVFLIESGIVAASEPLTQITLDLATGLMRLSAQVVDGRVIKVSTVTEPVFHLRKSEIELDGFGRTPIDIAYCLNYFEPIVNSGRLGIEVSLNNRTELIRIGKEIRTIVNRDFDLQHPTNSEIDKAVQVQIYDPSPALTEADCRCVAVYGDDGFDLTPSGTSTCAHMAMQHARGDLQVGQRFTMASVTDAVIEGEIVSETMIGQTPAIVPRISGTAVFSRMVHLLA